VFFSVLYFLELNIKGCIFAPKQTTMALILNIETATKKTVRFPLQKMVELLLAEKLESKIFRTKKLHVL
jgi:hypothetical protein